MPVRQLARHAGLKVEVLRLLARGMSSKQIAERLVITPKTASNHIEHIYSKLGVTNRAGKPVCREARPHQWLK